MNKTAVVVTTDSRGVFFGYVDDFSIPESSNRTVTLYDCRMVVYWDPETKGLMDLPSRGPSNKCKISPPSPVVQISGVHFMAQCTKESTALFENAPWASDTN